MKICPVKVQHSHALELSSDASAAAHKGGRASGVMGGNFPYWH